MKITVETVPSILIGTGCVEIKNLVYLNDQFKGLLGYFSKLEFETNKSVNELIIENSSGKNKLKFEAMEDVYFWITTSINAFNKKKVEFYYDYNNLKIIK